MTFYRATADLPAFTDYSMSNRTYRYFSGKPLYAFGHGLSYTKFDFRSGKLDSKRIAANGTAKVSFTVKNTGKRDGDEVAQVYFRHVNSKVPQPKLALCGFARVHLEARRIHAVSRLKFPPNACATGTRRRSNTWLSRGIMNFSSARRRTTSG